MFKDMGSGFTSKNSRMAGHLRRKYVLEENFELSGKHKAVQQKEFVKKLLLKLLSLFLL